MSNEENKGEGLSSQAVSMAMKGGGWYNNNSKIQALAIPYSLLLVDKAVEALNIENCNIEEFRIIDYGASQGGNSLAIMDRIIERVRSEKNFSNITVIHEDLQTNDWNTLFNTVYNNANSYWKKHENVFVYGSGRSFYDRIAPSNSINFAYSDIALHWLSKVPSKIKNTGLIHAAADDWKRIL